MKRFPLLAAFAAVSLVLAGCGGGGSSSPPAAEVPPPPTPYQLAQTAITNADTAEAVDQALEAAAANAAINAVQLRSLEMAAGGRKDALAMMAREMAQKNALMAAAGNVDTSDLSTQAAVNAAEMAIAILQTALTNAADVSETDKAMYQAQIDAANTAVMAAQSSLDHASQTMALNDAVMALQEIDLAGLSTQAAIDAANAAAAAVQAALDAATELSATEKTAASIELAAANRAVASAQGQTNRAVQQMAIAEAYANLNALDLSDLTTQDKITAAEKAIVALDLVLSQATDLTAAEKLDATTDVTVAKRTLASAKEMLAENIDTQRTDLMEAGRALANLNLDDLDTEEKVAAANTALMALEAALARATNLSDSEKAMYQARLDEATETVRVAETGMERDDRRMAQMKGLTGADEALTTALAALAGDEAPTQEQIDAADAALAALKTAIEGSVDLTDEEKAAAMRAVAVAEGRIAGAEQQRMVADAAAEEQRMAEEKAAAAEMAALASKLHKGIKVASAQTGPSGNSVARYPQLNSDGAIDTNELGDGATRVKVGEIWLGINNTVTGGTPIGLPEDKKASIPAIAGWEAKRYARKIAVGQNVPNAGSYEAVVYSNVEPPVQGKKFGSAADPATPAGSMFQYQLAAADRAGNANKALTVADSHEALVSLPSVTRTSGTETFKLPEGGEEGFITVPGMLHGVSGTFSCAPTTPAEGCTAAVLTKGYNLEGGTWLFIPSDANARVMTPADTVYASYGWWLYKRPDESEYHAGVFYDHKGANTAEELNPAGFAALRGSASYSGGAAGHYALFSPPTGGTNDAGQFTADASLKATFGATHSVTGMIDNFTGADGMARDWSVELKKSSAVQTTATSGTDFIGNITGGKTVWTVNGEAAAQAGGWFGRLHNNGANVTNAGDAPNTVVGNFSADYGGAGKIVGAFGATRQ